MEILDLHWTYVTCFNFNNAAGQCNIHWFYSVKMQLDLHNKLKRLKPLKIVEKFYVLWHKCSEIREKIPKISSINFPPSSYGIEMFRNVNVDMQKILVICNTV